MEYIGNLENEDWQRIHRHKFGGNRVMFSHYKMKQTVVICQLYLTKVGEKENFRTHVFISLFCQGDCSADLEGKTNTNEKKLKT